MKTIKHIIAGLVLAVAGVNAQAQGIPVMDLASITQQIQQVAAWGQQLSAMQNQLNQAQQLYQSLSGSRGIGQLLNDPSLRNALPDNWQQVYSAIQNGGYAGLTPSGKAIRDANMIYNCSDRTGDDLKLCQRELNKVAQDQANANAAYAASQARLDNIQNLMGQINITTDAKSIAELQTRMQAEQAMIQNEQTKLQMFKMMADAEDKLIAQQKRERDLAGVARTQRTSDTLTPIQF